LRERLALIEHHACEGGFGRRSNVRVAMLLRLWFAPARLAAAGLTAFDRNIFVMSKLDIRSSNSPDRRWA
jgi:hypothetical protein